MIASSGRVSGAALHETDCAERSARSGSRCQGCAVRNIALFSALQSADLDNLPLPIDDLQFSNGQELFQEGDRQGWLYTIKIGLVKLDRAPIDGALRVARLAQRGDLIGLEACISAPYFYRATAIGSVRVCRIGVETIRLLERDTPTLRRDLIERWCRALRDTDDFSTLLGTGTPTTRLARLLLKMADPLFGETFAMPKREDLGAMAGMRLETASRVIAALLRDGLIEKIGPRFYRLDRAAMELRLLPQPGMRSKGRRVQRIAPTSQHGQTL